MFTYSITEFEVPEPKNDGTTMRKKKTTFEVKDFNTLF